MLIEIPALIKADINNISTVWIQIETAASFTPGLPRRKEAAFLLTPINCADISHIDISVYSAHFKNTENEQLILQQIKFKVLYKDNTVKFFNARKKNEITEQKKSTADICTKYKLSHLYDDTDQGRYQCLSDVETKIAHALKLDNKPIGRKNLIYYTVYFNKGYTDLLNLSICTILEHSSINFDIMIITDKPTQKLIKKLPFIKKIKPLFHITETPSDGVEASKNKTLICNFSKLKDYNKILFLDCDIMCVKDINFIFNKEYNPKFIYAASPFSIEYDAHTRVYHGFTFLTKEFVDRMESSKQLPFNAGQFLFINTEQMKQHFKNINWFMDVWSGEYFFEQAFMCQYFGRASACGQKELDDHVTLINTTNQSKYVLDNNTHLIHFIAPPLNAAKKIEFINDYLSKIKN